MVAWTQLCGVWRGRVEMGPGSNKDISPRLEHLGECRAGLGWGTIRASHEKGEQSLGSRIVNYNYILLCSDEPEKLWVREGGRGVGRNNN